LNSLGPLRMGIARQVFQVLSIDDNCSPFHHYRLSLDRCHAKPAGMLPKPRMVQGQQRAGLKPGRYDRATWIYFLAWSRTLANLAKLREIT
jgi:hypothetical protein